MAEAAAIGLATHYGGAAAGAAGFAGLSLFNYNRGNYSMDQKLHFARFLAGNTLSIAQTVQYREDIVDLMTLTCKRMDLFHTVAAMGLTIITAIYCPGRLGLHTPPPPGWLMGLAMLNIAGTYLFLVLTIWLAMHASLRADAGATHMLTRAFRLPIPSSFMLDSARKLLASYEEQPLSEILRIPFMRHPRGKKKGATYNEDMPVDDQTKKRTRHGYDVPAWYKNEKDQDYGYAVDSMMPLTARGDAPEHFEAFREIQCEWWPYDVYARICLFLAQMHLMHCWCYMIMGHHLQETRSFFAAFITTLCLTVLQLIILTLDIAPGSGGIPLHRLGPFAQIFGYFGLVLEYKRWYDSAGMNWSHILVYVAHFIHIIYTVQLLRLCEPDWTRAPAATELPGGAWWPNQWKLPSAFQHAVWIVAPPRALEPGLNDLAGDMKKAGRDCEPGAPWMEGVSPDEAKRRDVHRALGRSGESPAWRIVQIGLLSLLAGWIWLTIGYTVEVFTQGTTAPSLLNAPGMPNNARDPRWRRPKPGKAHPVEVGTGGRTKGPIAGDKGHDAGHGGHRRLQSDDFATKFAEEAVARSELADKLRSIVPYLHELASGVAPKPMTISQDYAALPLQEALPPRLDIRWPALFEPRILACGPRGTIGKRSTLALSRQGRGVVIQVTEDGAPVETESVVLNGGFGFGPIIAASWDDAGLLLVTSSGTTLGCSASEPASSTWECHAYGESKLPLGAGGRPFDGSVAITRKHGHLYAAVAFPGESVVSMFVRKTESSSWYPSGETRVRPQVAAASFAGDLLNILSIDGSVTHMSLTDGMITPIVEGVEGATAHSWQGVCGLPGGGVARLALTPSDTDSFGPAVFLSAQQASFVV